MYGRGHRGFRRQRSRQRRPGSRSRPGHRPAASPATGSAGHDAARRRGCCGIGESRRCRRSRVREDHGRRCGFAPTHCKRPGRRPALCQSSGRLRCRVIPCDFVSVDHLSGCHTASHSLTLAESSPRTPVSHRPGSCHTPPQPLSQQRHGDDADDRRWNPGSTQSVRNNDRDHRSAVVVLPHRHVALHDGERPEVA
jgi:hypothetical protein